MGWYLYDRDLHHERVKIRLNRGLYKISKEIIDSTSNPTDWGHCNVGKDSQRLRSCVDIDLGEHFYIQYP